MTPDSQVTISRGVFVADLAYLPSPSPDSAGRVDASRSRKPYFSINR